MRWAEYRRRVFLPIGNWIPLFCVLGNSSGKPHPDLVFGDPVSGKRSRWCPEIGGGRPAPTWSGRAQAGHHAAGGLRDFVVGRIAVFVVQGQRAHWGMMGADHLTHAAANSRCVQRNSKSAFLGGRFRWLSGRSAVLNWRRKPAKIRFACEVNGGRVDFLLEHLQLGMKAWSVQGNALGKCWRLGADACPYLISASGDRAGMTHHQWAQQTRN